jgi:hypothetical protein
MNYLKLVPLLLALSCAGSRSSEVTESEVTFTVDGVPFQPHVSSVEGCPDRPKDGDVVWVDEFPLILGPEKSYRFRRTSLGDGRLLLETADGATRVVSLQVGWREPDDQARVFVNPLAKLTAEEVRGLWGLYLRDWPEGAEVRLQHLDPVRAILALRAGDGPLPSLPQSLRYLDINPDTGGSKISNLAVLGRLRDLRYLRLAAGAPVDLGIFSELKNLRYLYLMAKRLDQPEELGKLTELRQLMLYLQEETVEQVGFASSLVHLRHFSLGISNVRDLSPLSGLKDLAFVEAFWSPIVRLPRGELAALRTLRIMDTAVTDGDAEEFARSHPECRVLHRFARSLRERARGADLIRVLGPNLTGSAPPPGPPLFEETDSTQIQAILDHLEVDDKNTGNHFCQSGPWLRFYRGYVELLSVRFDHGLCLHWNDWPHEGWLTRSSSEFLCRWLERRGVQEPLREFEKNRR